MTDDKLYFKGGNFMKGLIGFGLGVAVGTIAGGLGTMAIMIVTAKDKDACWFVDEKGATLIERAKLRHDKVTETE
jgi:hypothetical protein